MSIDPQACRRVLLVEDHDLIRELLYEALIDAGFQPTAVSNGREAMEMLTAGAGRIRALVTDVRLGTGPSGWDLAAAYRAHSPGGAVIYMTGDSHDQWPAKGVPGSTLMAKPFSPVELAKKLTEMAPSWTDGDSPSDHNSPAA